MYDNVNWTFTPIKYLKKTFLKFSPQKFINN